MSKPLVYRFDNIEILRYLTRQHSGYIQTHKAWLNRGEWNSGPEQKYYHGQFERHIPITIYGGPYEIDEVLVEGNWKV